MRANTKSNNAQLITADEKCSGAGRKKFISRGGDIIDERGEWSRVNFNFDLAITRPVILLFRKTLYLAAPLARFNSG